MKKIAVVATKKAYADFLKDNVSKYLSSYAHFISYSTEEIERKNSIKEDFVLVSAYNIFQQTKEKISVNSEIIVLSLSLGKMQMERLKEIPEGTRALLVNYDNRSCMHTITSMYDAGFRNVDLYPYFGEGDYDRTIKVAITPNEAHLVPKDIEIVYDVGESVVDMNSLYYIADKLGVYDKFSSKEANEARKEYYYINSSMDKLLNEKESILEKLNTLIRLMNYGIVITDVLGCIYLANEKAKSLLTKRPQVLKGFNVEEIFPDLDMESTKEQLIRTESRNLIASVVEIREDMEIAGHIITLTDFEEGEERQHGIRSKLNDNGFIANYHFEDILGKSEKIRKVKDKAKLMAASDATVFITGESGTGKEMFAQSIHNASLRKQYSFVAVNCAAIPDNLLESEMFGYAEGSFSGAKKGGKAGLFELAHKGTIFLDEIGEMPLQLQSKLLRVIEEKKIMRVGSNKSIDIDVRIISATNKDIYGLVKKGKFREDLYYRINVLPLSIPPLRERKEDIMLILNSMAENNGTNIEFSDDATNALQKYNWRGNVRELRNVVEFISSMKKQYIEIEDLPIIENMNIEKSQNDTVNANASVIEKFILNEGREIDLHKMILEELIDAFKMGKRYGRRTIVDNINSKNGFYSEGEVRAGLSKLNSYGFIRSAKGRGGSVITDDGMSLLKYIRKIKNNGIIG